jgi:hypothetical protein
VRGEPIGGGSLEWAAFQNATHNCWVKRLAAGSEGLSR